VIFGSMTIGAPGTGGVRITELDAAKQIMDTLKEYGVKELDSARGYASGTSEGYLQKIHATDGSFQIATKVPPPNHRPADLRRTFETSLKELGRDSVDILYLHAPQREVPFKDTCEEMNKLHTEGKFKIFGVSNYRSWEVVEIINLCKANGWVYPTLYQVMYNAIARDAEDELFPMCKKYGVDVVMYNGLAGGILSGRYKSQEIPTEGRFSDANNQVQGKRYRERYFNKKAYFDAVELLTPVAAKHNFTLVEVALRWLHHHSALSMDQGATKGDGIILGASSDEQLRQNLDAWKAGPLPDDVIDALDEAWLIVKAVAPVYFR